MAPLPTSFDEFELPKDIEVMNPENVVVERLLEVTHWGVGNALSVAGLEREAASDYQFWGMLIENPLIGESREMVVHPIVSAPQSPKFFALAGENFTGSKLIDFEGAMKTNYIDIDWGKEKTRYFKQPVYNPANFEQGCFWRTNLGHKLLNREQSAPIVARELRTYFYPTLAAFGQPGYIAGISVLIDGLQKASSSSLTKRSV